MKIMVATALGALIAAAPAAAQTYSNQYPTYNQYPNSNQYPNGYYQYPTTQNPSSQYPSSQYPTAQNPSTQYGYAPTQPQYPATAAERIDSRIDMLQTRLNAGLRSGTIDWKESQKLNQHMYQLSRLEREYSAGGLNSQERAVLRDRIRSLRQEIRVADNGSYDRYERVDQYGNYYEPTAPYGGYGAYGQGGPYEPAQTAPAPTQSGPGGVLGAIVGSIFGTGGLQVGQQATNGLYGVPTQYQGQYRDGNGIYYRSDGQRIYQIDARTNRVTNVYSTNR